MTLLPILVAAALSAEGAPVNIWTGADPSGACKGSRVVQTASGDTFACASGVWVQRTPAFGSSGVELYVKSSTGSDSGDCLSWSKACRTILGAYDKLPSTGGTIYIATGALVGGEVANQGIWLLGSMDPNYSSPPAGWRLAKAVHFKGVPSQEGQFLRKPIAYFSGGQTGAWASDYMKPAIWLSGSFKSITFEDLAALGYPARGIVLGIPSNRDTVTDSMVANVQFRNILINVYGAASDTNRGPVVESQHTFWIYFRDCQFGGLGTSATTGNSTLGLSAAQRGAAMTVIPRTDVSGGYYVKDCVFGGGGVDFTAGPTTWSLIVDGVVVESDFVHPALPVVTIRNSNAYGSAIITDVTVSDAPGSTTSAVEVSPANAPPTTVTCTACQSVNGPVTLISKYPGSFSSKSLAASGGVGFEGYKVVGKSDAVRRIGGPASLRWSNLVDTWPPASTATVTVTTGVADLFGGTSAVRLSTTEASEQVMTIAAPLLSGAAVGDRIVAGIWIRASSGASSVMPRFIMGPGHPACLFRNGSTYIDSLWRGSDGQWEWMSMSGVLETAAATCSPVLEVHVDAAHSAEIYGPVFFRTAAGSVSENEGAEVSYHFASVPPSSRPGIAYLPPGVALGIGTSKFTIGSAAPTTGSWQVGDRVFNSAPAVGQPQGWVCTVAGTPGTWVSMGNL